MNKFLRSITAASALMLASASHAGLIAGFDTDNNGSFADGVDKLVYDNGAGDMNLTSNEVVAEYGGFAAINIGFVADNPFHIHMTAQKGDRGSAEMTYGLTITDLTIADLSSAVFTRVGNGTAIPAEIRNGSK